MTSGPSDKERRVVPRWRSANTSTRLGETASLHVRPSISYGAEASRTLQQNVSAWRSHPSRASAADVVAAAVVARDYEPASSAAEQILLDSGTSALERRLASRVLPGYEPRVAEHPNEDIQPAQLGTQIVRAARWRVKRDPRNAIAWDEMARGQAIQGQFDAARRSMRNAVILAPDSRLILRSAARLLVEAGDAESAHELLLRSPMLSDDPWLMAAEVATAGEAGKTPTRARIGRRLIERGDVAPFHSAELASAIGTLELESGTRGRRGRQLLRQSLEDPTDNTIAQAEWASQKWRELNFELPLEQDFAYEARARSYADDGKWERSLAEAHKWFHDEPFASESAAFGSWVASVGLEEYAEARRIAEAGLLIHPKDVTLRNNLVFALANLGLIQEAEEEFDRIDLNDLEDENDRAVLSATAGLINYRRGFIEQGRELYQRAIEIASRQSATRVREMASLNMAIEELRAGTPEALQIIAKFVKDNPAGPWPEAKSVRERLDRMVHSFSLGHLGLR
jgi:tetratricopeptide (TPR) repeat protein